MIEQAVAIAKSIMVEVQNTISHPPVAASAGTTATGGIIAWVDSNQGVLALVMTGLGTFSIFLFGTLRYRLSKRIQLAELAIKQERLRMDKEQR